jgi:lipoyl(octanoyl) transferase
VIAATKHLGLTEYSATWRAMREFTAQRNPDTQDEIWVTEHSPVYTQGLNKQDAQPPSRRDIPLVETDRGGKITYHGPGQLVIYLLLDMKRSGLSVRQLVSRMENAVIKLLREYGTEATADARAPGVYVGGKKIASLGLRLKNGCCYHGLSLNVDMDLSPFSAVDPCGYRGMEVTQTRDLGVPGNLQTLGEKLLEFLDFSSQPAG